MKKLLYAITLIAFFLAGPVHATVWCAQEPTQNIDHAGLWKDCESATVLTWNEQVAGDTFVANGQTALAINVDPQGTGAGKGAVLLTTAAVGSGAAGGGFTYALATNLGTVTVNMVAGTTPCVVLTGNAYDVTFSGYSIGGSAATAYGLAASHTVKTVTLGSYALGGSYASGHGYNFSGNSGVAAVLGAATGVIGNGLNLTSTGTGTVAGGCIGSATGTGVGCNATSTGTITSSGPMKHGTRGAANGGAVVLNADALDYVSYPAPGSTTIYLPKDPGVANVKAGVEYGYDGADHLTGSLSSGGGGAWAQ